MQILQLGETLTRQHHRPGLLVAATLAALASTSAMAAGPTCEPEAKIAPANQVVNENDLVTDEWDIRRKTRRPIPGSRPRVPA